MSGTEQAANDLFFKLRNRFPHINMTDDDSQPTENPQASRFFNFDYEEDGVKFGNLTASLVDSQTLSLIYHLDITKYMDREEKKKWYNFLRELRKFAKSHMLRFDVHDITKAELSQKDLKFVTNQNKQKNQLGESRVLWARRGKVSEGAVGNVKVHVFHSERMDENPHNRLLRVDRIFLVNESGERFLLPFKSVVGAKAMANHVGRGGNPYDTTGKLIGNAVNEMTNLRRFASATRRKTFESDDAHQVIEAARSIKESIQRSLFRLANNSRFDENIEDLNKLLAEQDDVEDIKPYFMQNTYNENLDNWLGSAAKAFKQYKGNIMENLRESAGTVAQKLSNPQWKLVLKDEPAEDRIIASSKYSDGRALLRRILGTIADRASMDDSDIANWASQIGQDMETGAASQEDMQIALHLAKRYQNDLAQIAKNPEYGKEVRVAAFGQRKDLYGKTKGAEEEFESFVHGIGEADDEQHGLPPMSAGERIQQKLGTGAFAPQKAGPVNKEPLPGSPGPDQSDKDALTRMIDNESAEGSETAMDRVSARVAGRTTNEALDTMMWLAGVKKKSEVSEADPRADVVDFMRQQGRLPDTTYFGGSKSDSATKVSNTTKPSANEPPTNSRINVKADTGVAPGVSPAIADPVGPSNAPRVGPIDPIGPPGYSPKVYNAPSSVPSSSSGAFTDLKSGIGTAAKSAPGMGAIVGGATAIPDAVSQASRGDYKGAAGTLGKGAIGGALTGLATDLGATALGGVGGAVLAPAAAAFLGSTSPAQGGPDVRSPLENPTPMAQQNQMQPSVGKLPSSLTFNTTPVAQQKMNDSVELHRIRSLAGIGRK